MTGKAHKCSILDASIDWFTVTFTEGLRSKFAEAKAERVLREREGAGFTRSFTNRLGFTGDRAEGFFCGLRADTLMIIASGETASKQAPFFLAMGGHVTRIDVAVTLVDADIDRDWTKIALEQCSMDGRVDSGLLKTHRIEGTPDGRTLYIGSRSSDRYIRIYDKSAESKGEFPDRSWRWEIEYKHPRAQLVSNRLLEPRYSTDAVIDVVRSALADVRVRLPCGYPPSGWVPKAPRRKSDAETRLTYTSRVIAPFISKLCDAVGEDRVREALTKARVSERAFYPSPRDRSAP